MGKPLKHADLWKILDRVLTSLREQYTVTIKHVKAHVGVYGNEKADALAKAAAKRAIALASRTADEQLERDLEGIAGGFYSGGHLSLTY